MLCEYIWWLEEDMERYWDDPDFVAKCARINSHGYEGKELKDNNATPHSRPHPVRTIRGAALGCKRPHAPESAQGALRESSD